MIKKIFKKISQITLIHTTDVFIAIYPFSKWVFSKKVNVFCQDNLAQTVWYIANIQIGIWYSLKEVSIFNNKKI